MAGKNTPSDRLMANTVRVLCMDAVEAAGSGHPGMPLGMADVASILWREFLKFDSSDPEWPDRDRFILSAGHGSALQYALLYLSGFERMTLEELKKFRQLDSLTPGHPEYGHTPGVEMTTGPLGQGIASAVGFALAERMQAARFGKDIVSHRTYVIAGDGCLMEGISQEAISLAGHLKLSHLVVLFDDNGISIDGPTSLAVSDDHAARFKASGWHVIKIDGHDFAAIRKALTKVQKAKKPTLVMCKTKIGYGSPNKQGKSAAHGAPLGKEEIKLTREALGWSLPPFEIPPDILSQWRSAGSSHHKTRLAWEKRAETLPEGKAFKDFLARDVQKAFKALAAFQQNDITDQPEATRTASQRILNALSPALPGLIGGSADLTPSNNTKAQNMQDVSALDFSGNYIRFGIREHAMAAVMNGLFLHGGFIPYGGTFLVFSDYARPAIRLSALMRLGVIYVMTHDSIGVGEDGPTHQPVEHLAALRAIPHLSVFRPADTTETAEAWEIALLNHNRPSVLCLSRQALPAVRFNKEKGPGKNLSLQGAYLLRDPEERDVTLLASGSEVSLALEAAEILATQNIRAAVVSVPCLELFKEQPRAVREKVLGTAPRLGIEAGLRAGLEALLDLQDDFVGMTDFGASAKAAALYKKFGITVDDICYRAQKLVQTRPVKS